MSCLALDSHTQRMKLNIPQQEAPTAASSPSDPHKLAQVLSSLPNTNMGDFTKQTYEILRDQNRQTMPSKHRLENLETLRTFTRKVFINLKKYFINRTLPLPEKSQKIINLNQSILQELIYGYEIIANESASETGGKVNDKTLTIAICRAINYLSEMLLCSSEVYESCPKNLWRDAHQLYTLAESKKLVDKTVINQERKPAETTISESYKQILLFALARPIALRQSDSDRIYKELFSWSKYATISAEISENMIDRVFCMKTNEDLAPHYLCEETASQEQNIRALDTRELVAHITGLVTEQSDKEHKFNVGDTISPEILTMLISSWGESPKRSYSRTERGGHINVAIGLTKICKAMKDRRKPEHEPADDSRFGFVQLAKSKENTPIDARHDFFQTPGVNAASKLTLENIEKNDQPDSTGNVGNEWDMVAKGRALTETYVKENRLVDEEDIKLLQQQNTDTHWEVINISAGGYCLRWNSDSTSKAQIGELIALQVFDAHLDFKWHVGVIRWMQFTHKSGLEIGVQVLSPQVISATAQRTNRLDEVPFECLMLPSIEMLNQPSSTLLPSHAFKAGAKLIVRVFENKLNITLGEIKQHTSSFTQFAFSNTDLAKRRANNEDAKNNKDDFDELWSSL